MTREELYEIWAPRGAVWSPWAKAVIFANFQWPEVSSPPDSPPHLPWLAHSDRLAIVADLPGSFGVELAIAMARRGYRPVPLYNAAPAAGVVPELVDIRSIQVAFSNFADELNSLRLPFNAPPAFLLDANRRGGGVIGVPGQFDNRSICFPTDFPSAAFLTGQGITTALLVSQTDRNPQADLSHALLRWQQAGIKILSIALNDNQPAQPIQVQKPSRFRTLWYGWLAAVGLKHNPLGGFGGRVPFPSQGGWGAGG